MKYKIENKPIKQILKENKQNLYICIITFILCIILGSFYSKAIVSSKTFETLTATIKRIPTQNYNQVSSAIIGYNLLTDMQIVLLAVLGLPIFYIVLNPLLIGALMVHFSSENGILSSILAIIPHGIFEIPAMFLTAMVGINIFFIFVGCIFKKKKAFELLQAYIDGLKLLVCTVVPLTIIAGLIEGGLIFFLK